MTESIEWNKYTFIIEVNDSEKDVIEIQVIDHSFDHGYPAFYLSLKGLWERGEENFSEGDYYQDVMNKENMVPVDNNISYAAVTHDFLVANADRFPFIKNIYSSSLNGHPLEAWAPSVDARNFWDRQLDKNLGVTFDGDRYKLILKKQ